jgi:hypothetical protein
VIFRRADRKERRNVLRGKAVTGARGVSLKCTFGVKYILKNSFGKTTEIGGVYAGFSPVQPDGRKGFHQLVVVIEGNSNNM